MTNVYEDHPLWVTREYNKDEYEKQLSKINQANVNSTNIGQKLSFNEIGNDRVPY